eukprot:5188347-Amphidinium_carterae.1
MRQQVCETTVRLLSALDVDSASDRSSLLPGNYHRITAPHLVLAVSKCVRGYVKVVSFDLELLRMECVVGKREVKQYISNSYALSRHFLSKEIKLKTMKYRCPKLMPPTEGPQP